MPAHEYANITATQHTLPYTPVPLDVGISMFHTDRLHKWLIGYPRRANQVDGLLAELESQRQARGQLEVALRVEQRRAQEWYAQAAGAGGAGAGAAGGAASVSASPARVAAAAADKKRDETASQLVGVYDPESAVLQVRACGGGCRYQPKRGVREALFGACGCGSMGMQLQQHGPWLRALAVCSEYCGTRGRERCRPLVAATPP